MKCLGPNHCRMGIKIRHKTFVILNHMLKITVSQTYIRMVALFEDDWNVHELLFQNLAPNFSFQRSVWGPTCGFFFLALLSLNLISTLFLKPYYILIILGHTRVNILVKPKMLPLVWLIVFYATFIMKHANEKCSYNLTYWFLRTWMNTSNEIQFLRPNEENCSMEMWMIVQRIID